MEMIMTNLLTRLFIKNHQDLKNPAVRAAYGMLSGVIGIVVNLILFVAKCIVGTISGSIAITADAVNNLSDAGSSIISLVTFRISAKPADREHPFGHARIEYVSSMIVSIIILLIGYELFTSSLDKIFHPTQTVFHVSSVIVLTLSIGCKLWLGLFNHTLGKKIDSGVLRATGTDSLSDALSTTAVLASLLISKFTGFDTDGYMGVLVAIIIFIAGLRILQETKNSILGEAPSQETMDAICNMVAQYPMALDMHDVMVHTYGSGVTIASLHIEVDGSADMFVLHDMMDTIEKRLLEEHRIMCTIHMDPIVTDDKRVTALRDRIVGIIHEIDENYHIHDFRFVEGPTHTNLIFDVAVPYEVKKTSSEIRQEIEKRVEEMEGHYYAVVTVDRA